MGVRSARYFGGDVPVTLDLAKGTSHMHLYVQLVSFSTVLPPSSVDHIWVASRASHGPHAPITARETSTRTRNRAHRLPMCTTSRPGRPLREEQSRRLPQLNSEKRSLWRPPSTKTWNRRASKTKNRFWDTSSFTSTHKTNYNLAVFPPGVSPAHWDLVWSTSNGGVVAVERPNLHNRGDKYTYPH